MVICCCLFHFVLGIFVCHWPAWFPYLCFQRFVRHDMAPATATKICRIAMVNDFSFCKFCRRVGVGVGNRKCVQRQGWVMSALCFVSLSLRPCNIYYIPMRFDGEEVGTSDVFARCVDVITNPHDQSDDELATLQD